MGQVAALIEQAHQTRQPLLAILVDPDKPLPTDQLWAWELVCDLWLVGGSLIYQGDVAQTVKAIQQVSSHPVVLFPGPGMPIVPADAILFMALVSGRNPELLIGQQVLNAPHVHRLQLEVLPTAYMLIGNQLTTAHYMSQTVPLPAHKPELVWSTALAATYLGMRHLYLDGGSGGTPIPLEVVQYLRQRMDNPIWLGGGLRTPAQCQAAWQAGATVVVIGTAVEKQQIQPQDLWNVKHNLKKLSY